MAWKYNPFTGLLDIVTGIGSTIPGGTINCVLFIDGDGNLSCSDSFTYLDTGTLLNVGNITCATVESSSAVYTPVLESTQTLSILSGVEAGITITSGVTTGNIVLTAPSGAVFANVFRIGTDNYIKFPELFDVSSHYTGFPNRDDTLLLFVPGVSGATRTLTVSGSYWNIYIDGVEYTITSDLTNQITDTTGLYWFWITAPGGVPQLNSGTFPGFDQCLVASVYWNTTTDAGILSDERHGMGMSHQVHRYLHETVGTRYETGGAITPTDSTFSITECEIHDEDIEHVLSATTVCRVLYKNGSANWAWTDNSTTPYIVGGTGKLQWNNANALANVSNNDYVAYWVFATNNTTYPFSVIIGQRTDGSLNLARENNTPGSISYGELPSAEMKLLYRLIFRQGAANIVYQETADYRAVSNLPVTNYTATDHSTLSNLSYGTSGHTGFQEAGLCLLLDQTTPQTITGGIPLLTGLTPTTDYQLSTKKYVDDQTGSCLKNVVEDLSPQLGGDLDGQSTYSLLNIVDAEFEGDVSIGDILTLKSNTTMKYYLVNRPYLLDVQIWYKVNASGAQIDGNPTDNTWQTTGGSTFGGQGQAPSILANDNSRTAISVSSNYTGILVKFILPAIDQTKYTALRPEVFGFCSVNGVGMKSQIWNFNTSSWYVMETGSSFADDDDLSETISANIQDYIGANNEVYILARNNSAGSGSGLFRVDMIRLGYTADTDVDDNTWKSDLTILGDLSVGKSFRPADIVPSVDSTYDLGSSDYYWDDIYVDTVRTSEVIINYTGTGQALSATAQYTGAQQPFDFQLNDGNGNGMTSLKSTATSYSAHAADRNLIGFEGWSTLGSTDDGGYSALMIGVKGFSYASVMMAGADSFTDNESQVFIGGYFNCLGEIWDEFEVGTMLSDFTQISVFAEEPTEAFGDAYISGDVKRLGIYSGGDVMLATGKKLFLEGGFSGHTLTMGDTYMVYNSGSAQIEFYINGTLAGHINLATGFVND